ncbi:uncharacterized protein A4U43_C08F25610 [Asparagus officinalis]|nr:uncharacterized protein A4U43_C08F25610 [Asparagus officinalis]
MASVTKNRHQNSNSALTEPLYRPIVVFLLGFTAAEFPLARTVCSFIFLGAGSGDLGWTGHFPSCQFTVASAFSSSEGVLLQSVCCGGRFLPCPDSKLRSPPLLRAVEPPPTAFWMAGPLLPLTSPQTTSSHSSPSYKPPPPFLFKPDPREPIPLLLRPSDPSVWWSDPAGFEHRSTSSPPSEPAVPAPVLAFALTTPFSIAVASPLLQLRPFIASASACPSPELAPTSPAISFRLPASASLRESGSIQLCQHPSRPSAPSSHPSHRTVVRLFCCASPPLSNSLPISPHHAEALLSAQQADLQKRLPPVRRNAQVNPPHLKSYAQAAKGAPGPGFMRAHARDVDSFARLPRTGINVICGTREGIPVFSLVQSDMHKVEAAPLLASDSPHQDPPNPSQQQRHPPPNSPVVLSSEQQHIVAGPNAPFPLLQSPSHQSPPAAAPPSIKHRSNRQINIRLPSPLRPLSKLHPHPSASFKSQLDNLDNNQGLWKVFNRNNDLIAAVFPSSPFSPIPRLAPSSSPPSTSDPQQPRHRPLAYVPPMHLTSPSSTTIDQLPLSDQQPLSPQIQAPGNLHMPSYRSTPVQSTAVDQR